MLFSTFFLKIFRFGRIYPFLCYLLSVWRRIYLLIWMRWNLLIGNFWLCPTATMINLITFIFKREKILGFASLAEFLDIWADGLPHHRLLKPIIIKTLHLRIPFRFFTFTFTFLFLLLIFFIFLRLFAAFCFNCIKMILICVTLPCQSLNLVKFSINIGLKLITTAAKIRTTHD